MITPFDFRPPMTPALVLSKTVLDANLHAMQALCTASKVALRAHGKMHKCSTLAKYQIALGAVGVCAQTIGEAEVFAGAGITDILITAPVASWAAPRVAALAARGVGIKVVLDSKVAVDWLNAAISARDTSLTVLVDLDLGLHRTGTYPENAVRLATDIAESSNLKFGGVQAYLGHVQHMSDVARREEGTLMAMDALRGVVADLKEAGLRPRLVTGGGTGTFTTDLTSEVFNELQAGSYAFMDAEYDLCGAPDGKPWPFRPALFVAASVVSTHHKSHVTIDAGLKALSSDGPLARVVAGAAPGSLCRSLGDEHSAIVHPSMIPIMKAAGGGDALDTAAGIAALDAETAVPWPEDAPMLGDIVWLQPGHCDPTVNLYDAFYVVDEKGGLEVWPIDARRHQV